MKREDTCNEFAHKRAACGFAQPVYLAHLADGFNNSKSKANTLEDASNCVQSLLHAKSPGDFPRGQALVA
jgi:hypothetical protein